MGAGVCVCMSFAWEVCKMVWAKMGRKRVRERVQLGQYIDHVKFHNINPCILIPWGFNVVAGGR